MIEEDKHKWYMEKLELEFKRPGYNESLHEGHYEGTIKFANGHYECFKFRLNSEMTAHFLKGVQDQIVNSAKHLSQDILISLSLINQDEEKSNEV